jgi:hypothetical protein
MHFCQIHRESNQSPIQEMYDILTCVHYKQQYPICTRHSEIHKTCHNTEPLFCMDIYSNEHSFKTTAAIETN